MSLSVYLAIWCVTLVAIIRTTDAHENILRTKVQLNADIWDYSDGPYGPAHWGELNPSWKACSEGQSQSPINIDTSKLVTNKQLDAPATHEYVDAPAFVLNNGHAAEVIWPGGWLYVNDKNYTKTGFEFHSPSEHTIDGKRYPLEMHIIHKNEEDGDIAIVSVLSSLGPTNWWAEKFWHKIPSLDNIFEPVWVGTISPSGFQVNFSKYYRYIGSLTKPDCQKNVVWTILSTVYEVSEEQIEHLRSVLPMANNRPVQSLGDRQVSYPGASV